MDDQYFKSYTDLEVHRLMLADEPRTSAYQTAIEGNSEFFNGKVVLDVGAGTGILSLFCARAGAKRVHAVEASHLAQQLGEVVKLNSFNDIIKVHHSRVEDVVLDEKVDVIVSEWMGFYLLHESMLDSVLAARDKHLKPDGVLLPSHAKILVAPCSLQNFIRDHVDFWESVYGFTLTPFKQILLGRQRTMCEPEVMCLEPEQILSEPEVLADFDLSQVTAEEIRRVTKRSFVSITRNGKFQGIALWFDVTFSPKINGNAALTKEVELKTGPFSPATHWKQTVLVLPRSQETGGDEEEAVEEDDIIGWEVTLTNHNSRKYVIEAQVLDPAEDDHPVPCGCMSARCALINALNNQDSDDCDEMISV